MRKEGSVLDRLGENMLKSRCYQMFGDIDFREVAVLENFFRFYSSSKKAVNITLASSGGLVYAGLALYDLINHYRRKFPVNIHVLGMCMSAAVIVLQAATKRTASKLSTFMVHELIDFEGAKSISQREADVREGLRLQRQIDTILETHTKLNLKELKRNARANIEHYYDADRALKLGLVDEICR